MKENEKFRIESEQPEEWDSMDPALKQTLRDFKASVRAWSEAAMNRPRTAHTVVVRRTWRLAAGAALASVLFAGAVSGSLYEQHHRQELARIAAVKEAEHLREVAAERAKAEEELLADVDSDVSREIPSAMEPLASPMAEDTTQ